MTSSPSSDWNPEQYGRFRDERARPFFDLLDLVQPRPGMRVVDLGCGTGELTRELHRRLAARETIGIDNSPAMLAKSAAFAGDGLRSSRETSARSRARETTTSSSPTPRCTGFPTTSRSCRG